MNSARCRSVAVAVAALLASWPSLARPASRVKDLAQVQGVRDNELFGYGLVVGLAGTGDSERVLFTSQSVAGMLGRLGIRVDARDVRARNVAAVMVTARLPPFARPGTKLDVSVASLGNARSLVGGVLLITPLNAADGQVYAVAQGPLQVGGYEASGSGSSVRKNTPTAGRVAGGAIVERGSGAPLGEGPLVLALNRPDFTTASRIAAAVNGAVGANTARAVDAAAVEIAVPQASKQDLVGLIARVEALEVDADVKARVVVSERTGTVVAGERVRIRPVAVAHGALQISVMTQPVISQAQPFAPGGKTVVASQATPAVTEDSRAAVALPATATVDDLAKALNLLGASSRDLVSILQAMKAAGALEAELEVI
ncbi:MAG TPA: flagellar basal body P-ring protein FlgI [Anaeromyxobacteraceae bacterium]|nr:flagellar basal body P-ring protein FlgI [Anaeromyxobacteraceae bacterium]